MAFETRSEDGSPETEDEEAASAEPDVGEPAIGDEPFAAQDAVEAGVEEEQGAGRHLFEAEDGGATSMRAPEAACGTSTFPATSPVWPS